MRHLPHGYCGMLHHHQPGDLQRLIISPSLSLVKRCSLPPARMSGITNAYGPS